MLAPKLAEKRLISAGFMPLVKFPGTHKKWKAKCKKCESIVYPKLNQISSKKSGGCSSCGRIKRSKSIRLDESKAIQQIVKRGFKPIEPFYSTTRKWRMIHEECGQIVSHSLNSIVSMGTKCGVCSGRQVVAGFNDLATTHPELANALIRPVASQITKGSHRKLQWRCKNNHVFESRVADRVIKGSGCPYCSNKKILVGFNDLQTRFPELAVEANGWDPSMVMPYSAERKKWKCASGHTWAAIIGNRANGFGCPKCASKGYLTSIPGWVYLMVHEPWNLIQVGITNYPDQRLKKHGKSGWQLLDLYGPISGQKARDLETRILRYLRTNELTLHSSKTDFKFDGYTEAWSQTSLDIKTLPELFKLAGI
jgi:hypothetical protein